MIGHLTLALAAAIIEIALGYPDWLYARIGHPVGAIARVITACETRLNRPALSALRRCVGGIVTVLILIILSGGIGGLIQAGLVHLPYGVIGIAVLASSLLAHRSLDAHVAAVAEALIISLADGRAAVSRIVGRDPETLDEAGVARAAIESLAENFSDGVVAPLFWLAVLGLPGCLAYKAINTADSMIGHLNDRYRYFGWAAARLDDLVNLPASRLSALWLIIAAALVPGASSREAAVSVWRDASRHRSPNAGWPEAAMAGALGLSLGGTRFYHGVRVDDASMGSGRPDANAGDIARALVLYRVAAAIELSVLATIWLIIRLA
jgi:adenosylcobinamide-phosphate synthase